MEKDARSARTACANFSQCAIFCLFFTHLLKGFAFFVQFLAFLIIFGQF